MCQHFFQTFFQTFQALAAFNSYYSSMDLGSVRGVPLTTLTFAANRPRPFSLNPLFPWHAEHEHGERGFGGERAASLEYTGAGEAAADRQRSGCPRAAPRVLSGAPDCACAGRRSATSGAGARAERPASLSMPLRGNEAIKSTVLKARLGSPACRGPVQGGTLPHPSGAWEGVRALADKPAHGYAGRRPAPAADAVGKAAALRS